MCFHMRKGREVRPWRRTFGQDIGGVVGGAMLDYGLNGVARPEEDRVGRVGGRGP
jgi:hypothetical protein